MTLYRVLCGTTAAGCAAMLATAAMAQTAPAAAPPPPPTPIAFEEALTKAASNLLGQIKAPANPSDKVIFTIDPLIDGSTGTQSGFTQNMGKKIVALAAKDHKHLEFVPFTAANVAKKPIVLVGTFTAINNATNKTEGTRDAYRICLAMADLNGGKVVAKAAMRALPQGITTTPLPFFQDSPVWSKDAATDAYIKTCQASTLNQTIDAGYTDRIQAAALTSEAIEAYNSRKFKEALDLYQTALKAPGGDQLRVLNGIYLANWQLNRRAEATEAFGKVVDHSLAQNRLAVRFLFRPGQTNFVGDDRITAPYPMWLKQIGDRTEKKNACLELVGHASPTGPEPANVVLSGNRAKAVMTRLVANAPGLAKKVKSSGVGSKETLIGTGKDDTSDALDRRVEFKVQSSCT